MHRHLMILIGNATEHDRNLLLVKIGLIARDWFNYTSDAWIICTDRNDAQIHRELVQELSPNCYHLIMDVSALPRLWGMLPQDAWIWLKRHGFQA